MVVSEHAFLCSITTHSFFHRPANYSHIVLLVTSKVFVSIAINRGLPVAIYWLLNVDVLSPG